MSQKVHNMKTTSSHRVWLTLISVFTTACTLAASETRIHLIKANGALKIGGKASTETYDAYFHVPIAFEDQAPILLEVRCPTLVSWRFVQAGTNNVLCVAKLRKPSEELTMLHWSGYVLARGHSYSDLPDSIPIPSLNQIPEDVRGWLKSTDCIQSSNQFIREKAAEVRGSTNNLIELADNIMLCSTRIGTAFSHNPRAFDAFYALNWGNYCIGAAHAAAALFRANGVPSRSLLNIPTYFRIMVDVHWNVDYFVPGYGWVRCESQLGINRMNPGEMVVVSASNPEDEFPVFGYPYGIDGSWHTSDPELDPKYPDWSSHRAVEMWKSLTTDETIKQALSLTKTVFSSYSQSMGASLTRAQNKLVKDARSKQTAAVAALTNGNVSAYMANMQGAASLYSRVNLLPLATVFSDDFESGAGKWTHDGTGDDWQIGKPKRGPKLTHSGDTCWGTNLSGTYKNNADSWLQSPPIDLAKKSSAFLSFWVWNSVQDSGYQMPDYLWVDAGEDGPAVFEPLCGRMGGINDDPAIPSTGGWCHVVLDLSKYLGKTIRFRFRFTSDESVVHWGSYVDDVTVTARSRSAR